MLSGNISSVLLHYSLSAHILFRPEGPVGHLRPASACIGFIAPSHRVLGTVQARGDVFPGTGCAKGL